MAIDFCNFVTDWIQGKRHHF